jgi:hypothetical protein
METLPIKFSFANEAVVKTFSQLPWHISKALDLHLGDTYF